MTWTNPSDWDAWVKTLTGVGVAFAAAATKGRAIFGWCLDRWTNWRDTTALRAAEQAEAEKTVRVLNETVTLLELHKQALEDRYADALEDGARKDAEIDRLWQRTRDLEKQLDGSRR